VFLTYRRGAIRHGRGALGVGARSRHHLVDVVRLRPMSRSNGRRARAGWCRRGTFPSDGKTKRRGSFQRSDLKGVERRVAVVATAYAPKFMNSL